MEEFLPSSVASASMASQKLSSVVPQHCGNIQQCGSKARNKGQVLKCQPPLASLLRPSVLISSHKFGQHHL